jgi:hypothetical protein
MDFCNMKSLLLASLVAITLPLSATAQDSPAPGYEAGPGIVNPLSWSSFATLNDGTRVHFDGNTVVHYGVDGDFINTLHTFSSFFFAGAIAADPDGGSVLVGESTNGDMYRVEMDGSGATFLANLVYNYDAVYESAGVALVSAATCGFGCGHDIVRIDTLTGATTLVAQVSGPSGPVALAANGDLYYGPTSDTFPAPSGSGELWMFSASMLATSAILTDADATLLTAGLDSVASIAVDPLFGDIVVATNTYDSNFAVVADALTLIRSDGQVKGVIAEGLASYRGNIDIVQGSGIGHLRAFQPEGMTLTYSVAGRIESIQPKRPTSTVTHYGGSFYSFEVQGGQPNGAMLLTYGNSALHQGAESSYQLSFDFLLHTGLPINATRRVGQFYLPCDSQGNASFPFWNNGNLTGTVVFQGIMTDAAGTFVGSSAAAFN